MTLIDPNPVATIRFRCEICGKALDFRNTISDGFSGDPEDYEGKRIAELYCPTHGNLYKRECYNCDREFGCELKQSRPKRRGAGIEVTWVDKSKNDDREKQTPCKSWRKRGKFYTTPTCWYCKYNECIDEDLGNGSTRRHGHFCSSRSSPMYGKLIDWKDPACKKWRTRYTLKVKAIQWKRDARSWLSRAGWRLHWYFVRPFEGMMKRSRIGLDDGDGECDWCKHGKTGTCKCKESRYHGEEVTCESYGEYCGAWKNHLSPFKQRMERWRYIITGKWQ